MVQSPMRQTQKDHAREERDKLPVLCGGGKQQGEE